MTRRSRLSVAVGVIAVAASGGWWARSLTDRPDPGPRHEQRSEASRADNDDDDASHHDGGEGEADDVGEDHDHGSSEEAPDRAGLPPGRVPTGSFIASVDRPRAVVWAVGDGADGGPAATAVARTIARAPMDRLLYLGDVYDWEGRGQFADRFGSVYGPLARRAAPTVGNHEDPVAQGYAPYWRQVTGKPPPSFYSFTVSGWQILSLNSEVDHSAGSAQLRWLRGQLRRPGTCRIAFWHRPRYSAGTKHGDQPDVAPLWEALRGHAAIVLNGHEHDMQRLRPIDGIVEFVSGAGGHSRYPLDRSDRRIAFADDGDSGALRLTLTPGRARFAFVATGGPTLDSGSIRCRRR